MKKNVLIVLFLALFIAGCSSEKNSNTNPCTNVSDFTISQHNDIITFNFFSSETPKSEVSIINSNSPSEPDMGNLYSFVPNQLFSLTDLGLEIGNTYLFYTRTICSNEEKSWWGTPSSLTINPFCPLPTNINFDSNTFNFVWTNTNSGAYQYQVEYGSYGYSFGTGNQAIVDTPSYHDAIMEAGETYDFYVRSNCNGALGWSDWVGPYTIMADNNNNFCDIPLNIYYHIGRNIITDVAVGAYVFYDFDWFSSYEYALVLAGEPVTIWSTVISGQSPPLYLPMAQNTDFDFYIRKVCGNGVRSEIVGPMLINIGT